uniref:Uncharacterized protein n=1 Tax=Anguilla anguilla TaxID=7936 RepID=A0A0E9XES0_ANGAN
MTSYQSMYLVSGLEVADLVVPIVVAVTL